MRSPFGRAFFAIGVELSSLGLQGIEFVFGDLLSAGVAIEESFSHFVVPRDYTMPAS
jgi:hypothetical protein